MRSAAIRIFEIATAVETNSDRRTRWKRRAAWVDARKFGNEYVSDPVTPGYVRNVYKAGKG